jgi:tetratricopeptide (TPR) repeat protein
MISSTIIRAAVLLLAATPLFCQQGIDEHLRQAQADLQEHRPDLAIAEYRAIVAIDPGNVDARGNAGVLEYFQGRYASAVQDLRAAVKMQPQLWKLEALLGMAEKRTGDLRGAQSDLEKSFPQLREEKLRIQAGMELIEIDYGLSDLDRAAEVVNVLRQLKPGDVDILYTAHRIYSELSDETMLSLAMVAPDSARMHQLMAHELAREGDNQGAIAHYRAALKIDPRLSDIHFELGEMLNTSSSASDREAAEKEYRVALEENPFDEKSECRLGDIALRQSDMKTAAAYYTKALQMRPDDPDANFGLAKILMSMRRPKEAEPHLERAVQLDPYNPASHYRLGVLYRELGRPADSHSELAKFEKLKKMKSRLQTVYQQMRLEPGGPRRQADQDMPN